MNETYSSTTTQATDAKDAHDGGAAESSALMKVWWEKHTANLVRYDPHPLVLHPVEDVCGEYGWGTVFYSKAREDYKTRVGSLPEKSAAVTFDIELMRQLQLARAGGLNIAANPNSIVAGHLVIWPEVKRAELTLQDLRDVSRLAGEQKAWTFIHNMERAAASIVDWVHFQAYPWEFPLTREELGETIYEGADFKLSRLPEDYPAYALVVEAKREEQLAGWLFAMLGALAKGCEASGEQSIPCNIIWRGGGRAWLIPRSLSQSVLAATYVGALEMGGLFCLPSADRLREYLPDALRAETRQASIADEPELREWCAGVAREFALRVCSIDGTI